MTAGMDTKRARERTTHEESGEPACGRSRATCALVAALVACLGGCATRAGWVPALAVGASVSRARVARSGALTGSAPGDRELWDVRGDSSVAWLPTPSESRVAMHRLRPRESSPSAPCMSATLCAWEREMRARASNEVVAEESAP